MRIRVDYSEMVKKYPEYVDELVEKLRKGTSKNRNADPSELKYYIDFSIMYNFAVDTPVEDTDVVGYFVASIGRWKGSSNRKFRGMSESPVEVREWILEKKRINEEEKKRSESLTEEERIAEIERLVKELSGYGGFTVLSKKLED